MGKKKHFFNLGLTYVIIVDTSIPKEKNTKKIFLTLRRKQL